MSSLVILAASVFEMSCG